MDEIFSKMPADLLPFGETIIALNLLFLLFVFLELGYDYFSGNQRRVFSQAFVDLGTYLGHELAWKIGGSFVFLGTLLFVEKFRAFDIPMNAMSWGLGLLLADFLYYWSHRLEHRSRLFWSWHNVHHSSQDYHGTTALRLSWIEPYVSWYLLVPLVLIGFKPYQVFLFFQILLTYQTWIHTQKIGNLGVLEHILNTPSNHRVHHGSNPEYIDKNFGAVLIVWDKIFRTYAAESTPVKYGLQRNIGTNNPIRVNLREPGLLLEGLLKNRGVKHKLKWIFWSSAWSPEEKVVSKR